MKIGPIDLGPRPLLLAPMEDVTDISFRRICREQGADMVYTEFVPSEGLVRDASKAIAKMYTLPEEAPVGIQIYGHILENMVDAAKMADRAAELVGGHGADLIDINFGCPVTKIATRGAGSGMMRYPDRMVAITKAVVEAVPDKPVTVKTRLGWDDNSKIIVDLAERLQDVGIQAITIHGRTRCQLYRGQADWTLIGEVKNNPRMHIPVLGNGDITDGPSAVQAFERYGVDGIMIGRATFGRPWIFREIKYYMEHGEPMPELSVAEKVALARRHLQLSLDSKGEPRGIYEMRRHLSSYFKGLPDFKETRMRMVTTLDRAELFSILDEIEARW
ncbi:MAG: tRNA dihydrouridine synthase DusB [Bacteroidales bacterium]|nr:tRNA dihydrouridine synthase DusB [Bacteroidales bacterium]